MQRRRHARSGPRRRTSPTRSASGCEKLVARPARRPSRAPLRRGAPGAARRARPHDVEGRRGDPSAAPAVTRLALKEWAVAVRGDRPRRHAADAAQGRHPREGVPVEGERFWLLADLGAPERRRRRSRLARRAAALAARAAPPTGRSRCAAAARCTRPGSSTTPAAVAALEPFHLWTQAYAEERLGWRPDEAAVGAACCAPTRCSSRSLLPTVATRTTAAGPGSSSPQEPSDGGLLPALTDEAFALHASAVAARWPRGRRRPMTRSRAGCALVTGGVARHRARDRRRRSRARGRRRRDQLPAQRGAAAETAARGRGRGPPGRRWCGATSTRPRRADALVDEAAEALGGLDLLVSNAASRRRPAGAWR